MNLDFVSSFKVLGCAEKGDLAVRFGWVVVRNYSTSCLLISLATHCPAKFNATFRFFAFDNLLG